MVTMLVAVNTATFISIQGAYDADFFVFLNSNLAGVAGLLFAYVWTRATRPFGAELAVRRLLRSGWEDVARSASTQPLDDQRNHASRMLDRVTQLLPRLGASDDHRHRRSKASATCASRSMRSTCAARAAGCPATCPTRSTACWPASPITTNAAPPRTRASRRRRAARDDRRRTATRRGPQHAGRHADRRRHGAHRAHRAAAPATPATHRRLRDTLHALVGLRLSLYPAAAGQRRRRRTEHAHDPAFPSVLPTATMIGEIDIFGVFVPARSC